MAHLIIRLASYKVCSGKLEIQERRWYTFQFESQQLLRSKLCFKWNLKTGKASVLAQDLKNKFLLAHSSFVLVGIQTEGQIPIQ